MFLCQLTNDAFKILPIFKSINKKGRVEKIERQQ